MSYKVLSGQELLDSITPYYKIQYCPYLDLIFDQQIKSYDFLNDFVTFTKLVHDRVVMPCIPYETTTGLAVRDLENGLSYLKKSSNDIIPYIELFFPDDYDCPHGADFKHIYLFFITQYSKTDQIWERMEYLFDRFTKYKTFL